jgi:hypothetical protein
VTGSLNAVVIADLWSTAATIGVAMPSTPHLKSYRPGTWFAILGDLTTVVLHASEKTRVAALWELVEGGAAWDEVLDALLVGGVRQLPGFVVLGHQGDTVQVIARGAVQVRLTTDSGEEIEIDGSSATLWVERSQSGVVATSLLFDESEDDDLPITAGLVRVSRIDAPPYADVPLYAVEPVSERVPVAEPEPEPAPGPLGDAPTEVFAVAAPAEEPAEEPVAEPAEEPVEEPAEEPVAERAEEPVAEPAEEPVPTLDDPVEHPVTSEQTSVPDRRLAEQTVVILSFSSGQLIDVDRAILVGRAPEARRFATGDQPLLVTVPSPQQEISSTHLEVRPGGDPDRDFVIVTDMGSTNGTVVVQPGQGPEDLKPGVGAQLVPGAIVDLGDGVIISVIAPSRG